MTTKEIILWTEGYNPWVMGGDVNAPLGIRITGEVVTLSKSFKAVVCKSPSGKVYVAEEKSGALIGNTVEQVNNDIDDCLDVRVMRKQIKDALKRVEKVRIVELDYFWAHMKHEHEQEAQE